MVTTPRSAAPALSHALAAIDRRCDGAHAQDGVGFSKIDGPFARDLLALDPARWSWKQTRAAWVLLAKYKRQLGEMGIDFASLPEPERAEDVRTPADYKAASRVLVDEHGFLLVFDFNRDLNDRIKRAFKGAFWDGRARGWRVPFGAENARTLRAFIGAEGFTATEHAELRLLDELDRAAAVEEAERIAMRVNTDTIDLSRFAGTLRPYQRETVRYGLRQKRCIYGLEVGLGKTASAIATYAASGERGPLVVVAPAVKKLDWKLEIERFLPGSRVLVVNGRKRLTSYDADAIVLNYDIASGHVAAIREAHPSVFVVVDESQAIKTRQAARTKAVQALCEKQQWVLLLTGTPVMNRPSELAEQLRAMRQLSAFGGWYEFMTRYAGGRRGTFGWEFDRPPASALKLLHEKLVAHCYVRYDKAGVMPDLPAVQRTIVPVEITNRAQYGAMEDDFIGYLLENAGDEAAMRAERAEQLVKVGALKQVAAEGKVRAALDWIREFLDDTDQKLIVFSGIRSVQSALALAFPTAARIFGEDSGPARQAAMARFQEDPACRLILCSSAAASTGITLTAASNMLILDFLWTPAAHDQMEGRAYGRVNDPHGLNAYYMVGIDTIDEEIARLLDEKRSLVTTVITGEGGDDGADAHILSDLIEAMAAKRAAARG